MVSVCVVVFGVRLLTSFCGSSFVHVLDESHYCRRVNTIEDYMAANRELATRSAPAGYKPTIPLTKNNYVDPDAEIDKKTQVGADCVVGAGTAIGEKCSIKRSNIGEHCKIGAQVKVVNRFVSSQFFFSRKQR